MVLLKWQPARLLTGEFFVKVLRDKTVLCCIISCMDRESVGSVPERAAGELWSGVPSEILALCGLVGDNHRHRHIYWRSSLAEIICPPASLDTSMSWIGETARELQNPHAPLAPWMLAGPKYSVAVLVSVTLNPDAHSPSSKWLVTSQLTMVR